jgi:DNA polymerase-3 subunit epsilon
MALGFAVIDLETTGLRPKSSDRILEIGIVLLDTDGNRVSHFESLVNPGRDVGPTRIHGISARDVSDAPTFSDLAGQIIQLLRGRVLVFHNAQFDFNFLLAEFERAGASIDASELTVLCTMRLAGTLLPGNGRSLSACCEAFDINNAQAHSALSDASATAELLKAYMLQEPRLPAWRDSLQSVNDRAWPHLMVIDGVGKSRRAFSPELTFVEVVLQRIPDVSGNPHEQQLMALFDDILSDGEITIAEEDLVRDFVASSGISESHLREIQQRYFASFVREAWADLVLNTAEIVGIRYVGRKMGIPDHLVDLAITRAPKAASLEDGRASGGQESFASGDRFVLTGDMPRQRSYYEEVLRSFDLIPWPSVTKTVRAVIAADVETMSGKAKRARTLGIPIFAVDPFFDGLESRINH